VTDVKEVVEEPSPFVPSSQLLEDYRSAPQVRQEEIGRFLISSALDSTKPEIVRRNCVELLRYIEPTTPPQVKITLAGDLGRRVGRNLDIAHAKVAFACGALPYLRQGLVLDFYQQLFQKLETVGYKWQSHLQHSELLETLEDVGALKACPPKLLPRLIKWLVLAYIGEPSYGPSRRPVFYSNTAAPIIDRLFQKSSKRIFDILRELANDKDIKAAIGRSKPVAQRFESLLDMESQPDYTGPVEKSEIA
jgi:hypothetical protein